MASIVNPVQILPIASIDACIAPDQTVANPPAPNANPLVELSAIIVAEIRKRWDFNSVPGTTDTYHIYNKATYKYASTGNSPSPGDQVVESTTTFPWTVKKYTDGVTTYYTIRHTHQALYWTSNGNGAAVTLTSGGTADTQKWGLKNVS